MGWKASVAYVAYRPGDPFLASKPAHDPAAAQRLAESLGYPVKKARETTLDYAIYPHEEPLAIGVYPGGLVIAHIDEVPECVFDPSRRPLGYLLAHYPEAEILTIYQHSVSDCFGFSLHRAGKLIRRAAGCPDEDGMTHSEGEPLPEERPILARSQVDKQDGRYRLIAQGEEFEDWLGEELAFAVHGRTLGARLDEFELDSVAATAFALKRKWWPF